MTGGIVVILGSTGRNVAAGMTGGITFLLDEDQLVNLRVNKDNVEIFDLTTIEQELLIKPLLKSHAKETNSIKAKEILSNWCIWKKKFKVLVPPSERAKVGLAEKERVIA